MCINKFLLRFVLIVTVFVFQDHQMESVVHAAGISFIVFGRMLDFDEMKANDFIGNRHSSRRLQTSRASIRELF